VLLKNLIVGLENVYYSAFIMIGYDLFFKYIEQLIRYLYNIKTSRYHLYCGNIYKLAYN